MRLDQNDLLRREVMMELLRRFAAGIGAIERRHQIEFWRYFVPGLAKLEAMQADGYLREKQIQRYSKVI